MNWKKGKRPSFNSRLKLLVATISASVAFLGIQASFASAISPILVGNGVAAPANGTADLYNMAFDAQEWVGFYGNITAQVVQASNNTQSLYNYTLQSGSVFAANHGESPNFALIRNDTPNATADNSFGLTGAYLTELFGFQNNYIAGLNICGITNVTYINTTDGIPVGMIGYNSANVEDYLTCSKVIPQTPASNLKQYYQYAILIPVTGIYGSSGYDLYYSGQ